MLLSTAVQPSRDAVKCTVAPRGSAQGASRSRPCSSCLCVPASPGLRCCWCPAPRSAGCPCPRVPLPWGRRPCHGTSLFWLQVRPRGSAGWESSLRQKPPVRLIFQAGQTRHEMKIKETNSVETLRDLPTPLRVRVCVGPGLPWGSGGLHFCCALPSGFRHVAASPCLSFPCEVGVCVLLLVPAMNWVL